MFEIVEDAFKIGSVDYKRGEDVRLGDKIDHHLAASVKRLDK